MCSRSPLKSNPAWFPLILLSFCIQINSLGNSHAQTREGPWLYGRDQCLQFSGAWPNQYFLPNNGGGPPNTYHHFTASVADSVKGLLFWVKLYYGTIYNADQYPNVFNAQGIAMKGGELLSERISTGSPIIVPHPGHHDRYYIFYIKEGALHYSVVDLSRDNGLGEVVPGERNIMLGDRGKLIDQKLIAVPSCQGAWILVRDRYAGTFLSYSLTENGVNPNPIISRQGAFPPDYYGNVAHSGAQNGHMRASPNGKWIAVASNQEFTRPVRGGLELFPFEPCSGKFGPSLVLDTLSYFGVCFSPDNSKLYATAYYEKTLYQFDLSLGDPDLVRASKTALFTNPDGGLGLPHALRMGAIKRSPSGKLFIGNNHCQYFPYTNAFHVVHHPNAPGLASQPQLNAYPVPYCTGLELPPDYIQPFSPDTVRLSLERRWACFQDSLLLVPDTTGTCALWNDGIPGAVRWINQPGHYELGYFDSLCRYIQHPFEVQFIPVPQLKGNFYSCPGAHEGEVHCEIPDSLGYELTWLNAQGAPWETHDSIPYQAQGLDTGQYYLRFRTEACDTLIPFRIEPKPLPALRFDLPAQYCTGRPLSLKAVPEPLIGEWSVNGEPLEGIAPEWTPHVPGYYRVQLKGQNAEGCWDSLKQFINVEDFELRLASQDSFVSMGDRYSLELKSRHPFDVLGWSPEQRFPRQQERIQYGWMDTTHLVSAWARTAEGCVDTAYQWLYVRPQYFIPSVFSPNGDGLNDLFRPVTWGPPLQIKVFEIYNRWGERVYRYTGGNAGWDGRHKGQAAPIGSYGYMIELETMEGARYFHKGDITLIR